MGNILKSIIKGFHNLGFGTSMALIIWVWIIFLIIDGPVAKYLETIFRVSNNAHWYDVLLIILFIVFNGYLFYLAGKFNL